MVNESKLDPPIHPGNMVRVIANPGGQDYVAKVIKSIPTEGLILDYLGNTRHVARERCFHATENEKAEYFRLVLKYGDE